MHKQGAKVRFSAGDVVAFLECEHATTLALQDLETPLARAADDESLQLIQDKGFAHEKGFLESLKKKGLGVAEIPGDGVPAELTRATERAMREGHDVIFQAALLKPPFYGRADFLRRVEEPSAFGAWRYEPADTKLARNPKAKFVVQLAFYSDLLSKTQGAEPHAMHLVLGDGAERSYRVAEWMHHQSSADRKSGRGKVLKGLDACAGAKLMSTVSCFVAGSSAHNQPWLLHTR